MSIDISIESNILDAVAAMGTISDKILIEATRAAISKTLVSGRKDFGMTIRKRLNIKSGEVKKKTKIKKPKGGNLMSLEGNISFDDKAMPILQFVKGSKNIIKQVGVKIKKRRKLKVEITKGKKFIMLGGFIQKVKSKQVFKRGDSGKFYKQSAPSIGEWAMKPGVVKISMRKMKETFDKNFRNQVEFRLEREANKVAAASLKKL